MMRILPGAWWMAAAAAVVLCAGGCSGTSEQADSDAPQAEVGLPQAEPETPSELAPVPELTAEQSEQLERVLGIARAIDASPNDAVSILAENGYTPEQWVQVMKDVAADPVMSQAYLAARGE